MLNLVKQRPKTLCKGLSLTLTFVALFLLSQPVFGDGLSAGPLFDQFPLTIGDGQRTEILGPFYYNEQNDTKKTWAFPPFYSHETDPVIDQREDDFLYPISTYTRYGTQYRWHFIQIFNLTGGEDPTNTKHRITIFPIFFYQRAPDSNDNYTAVFPIYGHFNNHLFRDRIFVCLFPIYGQTKKRDVVNNNYLYPFFNTRYGNGLNGWQFWPFYGVEHKTVTLQTNTWGVETVGGHDQYFVLWPFYVWANNDFGTENPEKIRSYIPFYVLFRSPLRDQTSVLWPFFNWIDDRGKQYREWQMPWPFIIVAKGEGKTGVRVWPFFEHAYNQTYRDDFYLWPIYKYNSIYAPPLDHRRTRIVFFLFQNTSDRSTESGKIKQRLDLWPLFVYHRNFDGSTRLQVIAPIETFAPDNRGIARNWSPLWSVWRSENNPNTHANSQSLLWNLYRRDASPGAKKISCFFGLYQYQSNPETDTLRLFYIPVHHATRKIQ